ncbi:MULTISPECIES: glycine cleavage system protein GcvH [Aminobacterium]|jgi:glycine cleavage system H protein|uniref:Glycine cleavage system H protein n=1 Tax=Aminobacterium colombiense (strain DSM 12261 / ALA-1) TaxID=572547 RepID=D5EGL4_AMICL|nr:MULTISPECIES: glycine cleavage system protein GcvH [Aminobacterium]MDD2378563.1 glycine cleavage system protein GcvH [Aminobacterium colombiense]ADE57696.1 glycine cleavage system H protein [Aminobacterium colombiense DSM 12261]MDD3768394.1 glycine cleavage system protein GcvH [Aminobacterium colombiense]MDD4265291.1 glycine cleavage system protein GcvH [Aminobacterium colombiense]MDD4585293.1 glycine cleavage system protein GcvH [Aminobacterium colombiense]
MAKVLKDLKYTESHEWVKVEGGKARIGITDYAQHAMGDIVYVELPEEGAEFSTGSDLCVVESVKGANDVYAPVSGTVVEVNSGLEDSPELLNEDAYANWIVVLEMSDTSELDNLLDGEAYEKLCDSLETKEGA